MSSKIEIQKICEFCGEEFTAKTTVTRFCSHHCASLSYKQRKKATRINKAIKEVSKQKIVSHLGLDLELIKQKDFLSVKEAHTLLGISERTFYRLMKAGNLPFAKIGKRIIIKRSEIDKLFVL